MAIRSGISTGLISVTAADVTLLAAAAGTRIVVTAADFSEHTSAVETVELFLSTDATSASTERIDELIFEADEQKSPISALGAIAEGSFLIANGLTGALVNAKLTYTLYTGDDAKAT